MGRTILTALVVILTMAYPLAVYFGLQYLEPRYMGLLLLLVFTARLLLSLQDIKSHIRSLLPVLLLAALCALATAVLNSQSTLRLTPAVISYASCLVFTFTLWRPPSMIERFARIQEPDLDELGVAYTRKVTVVWCLFTFINGSIALYTALFSSLAVWTLYNGLLSYLLMGLLFLLEYMVRLHVRKQATL